MAKDKATGGGGLLATTAALALGNAFELLYPERRGEADEIRSLRRDGTLAAVETGFQLIIERSGLPAPQKLLAIQVMDHLFDGLRRLPPGAPFGDMQNALDRGADRALTFVRSKGKSGEKPGFNFAKIEAQLDDWQRDAWLSWTLWMESYDPESFRTVERLKPHVDTKERLERTINLVATPDDPIPYPVGPYTDDFVHRWRTTRKRIAFLQSTLQPPPSFMEMAKAAARGEETPWTIATRARVEVARLRAEAFGDHQKAEAKKLRRANAVPPWVSIVTFVLLIAAVLAVIFAGYIIV